MLWIKVLLKNKQTHIYDLDPYFYSSSFAVDSWLDKVFGKMGWLNWYGASSKEDAEQYQFAEGMYKGVEYTYDWSEPVISDMPGHVELDNDNVLKPIIYTKVIDSGKRQEFPTGAQRDTEENKGRFDLLPFHALTRLAQHFENGAVKYGDNNWRKGISYRRYISSALRHITKWMLGSRDEDHLAAVAWNIMCLIETEYMVENNILPKELDDLNT